MARRYLSSAADYSADFAEPPTSLVNVAMESLARQLVDYPFDPHQVAFKLEPRNELSRVVDKVKVPPKAAVQWAIKRCLQRQWITIELRSRRIDPMFDDSGECIADEDSEDFLVAWSMPELINWWRQTQVPFVANAFQQKILVALNGRALSAMQLAEIVAGGDHTRLYKTGGLKDLRAAGKVEHKHRLGYYRPDAPPLNGAADATVTRTTS